MVLLLFSFLFNFAQSAPPSLVDPSNAFLFKQYIDAITAYGPGLGIYTPYSYVDVSYDNIPFVGKIPLIGKEGTSSRLGISPFYPPEGNPGNPFPPLYRARPLPPHIPEPVDVVAVHLDEETLHGEPLFPPQLTLPSEKIAAMAEVESQTQPPPVNPFGDEEGTTSAPEAELFGGMDDGLTMAENAEDGDINAEPGSMKAGPGPESADNLFFEKGKGSDKGKAIGMKPDQKSADDLFFEDSAKEKNVKDHDVIVSPQRQDTRHPFEAVSRRKRVRRYAQINDFNIQVPEYLRNVYIY